MVFLEESRVLAAFLEQALAFVKLGRTLFLGLELLRLKVHPGVVCELVGEDGDERRLQDWAAKRLVEGSLRAR